MENLELDKSLNFLVNKTAQKFKLELGRKLKQEGFDLSSDQWSVLLALEERDGPSQTELAQKLYKDRSNITRILDLMENLKLVERRRSPSDRREYNVFITQTGRDLVPSLKKVGDEVTSKALGDANDEELEVIKKFLNRVFDNLET
ncbi:MAG: MarR family transcriptional regulator [Bacteroidales bacterium]|jgi:DNA-binding MarR family transcriptional regulator|nr:MarR family transcriptional regulator [Bacteroidales bacterium]